MARGSSQAQAGATSAQNFSNQLQSNSGSLYGALAPSLENEVANPTGLTPEQKAAMNTAAQDSAGGAESAAVGQGALLDARTRNAGGADAAVDAAARGASANAGKAAVSTELEDASLRSKERQAGMSGLENLYGQDVSGSIGGLGQVASNVNANTDSENASWNWAKYLADPLLGAAGQAAAAYERKPPQ